MPEEFSTNPAVNMSCEYGQCGLMTEYVIGSNRAIHFAIQMFAGAGFTVQYQRYNWQNDDYWNDVENYNHDENFFMVAESGIKVEVNILRWLRFSPGVSYRMAYGSDAQGLKDSDINSASVNMTLKIGRF